MSKEDVWNQIDGSVASLVGKRVFYNHQGTKCLAFVVKAGFKRNQAGQIENKLIVFPPDGAPFNVDAALSSDRRVGSFDIAQPGDLTDSGATERPVQEVVEEVTEQPASTTSPANNFTIPPIETKEQRKKRLGRQ